MSMSERDRVAAWCEPCAVPRVECRHGDPAQVGEQHRGQVRIAYRLAAAYSGRLLHVFELGWFAWDGRRWTEDTGQAQNAVLDVLRAALAESLDDRELREDVRRCESDTGIRGVLAVAARLPGVAATLADLDVDPYLLNVANGTLDLRTMVLRPHDPTDRLTKVCRAAWTPENTGGEWCRFLERVLPDADVRDYFRRFVGVALLGEVREHVFTIARGVGRNGKGTAYGAILHALGDYGHTGERDLFAHAKSNPNGPSPAMLGLRGRRLVVVSETENGARLAPALMKQLTGGDPVTARPLFGNPVTFNPSHTALMVTNYLPKLPADDPAVWRRVRVVPFDVVIPPEATDPDLPDRLRADADAVLSWAITGWVDYRERGGLAEPASVREATADYERDQDDVSRFVDVACYVAPGVGETSSALHAAYRRWAEVDGVERPLSLRAFGEALDRLGYPVRRTKSARLRDGLALLADDDSAVTWTDGESVTRVTDESQPSHTRTRKELKDSSVTRVTRPMIECPECGDLDCSGECVGGVR